LPRTPTLPPKRSTTSVSNGVGARTACEPAAHQVSSGRGVQASRTSGWTV
jgi:hypothetical protein